MELFKKYFYQLRWWWESAIVSRDDDGIVLTTTYQPAAFGFLRAYFRPGPKRLVRTETGEYVIIHFIGK